METKVKLQLELDKKFAVFFITAMEKETLQAQNRITFLKKHLSELEKMQQDLKNHLEPGWEKTASSFVSATVGFALEASAEILIETPKRISSLEALVQQAEQAIAEVKTSFVAENIEL